MRVKICCQRGGRQLVSINSNTLHHTHKLELTLNKLSSLFCMVITSELEVLSIRSKNKKEMITCNHELLLVAILMEIFIQRFNCLSEPGTAYHLPEAMQLILLA